MKVSMAGRADDVLAYSAEHWYLDGKRSYYEVTVSPGDRVVDLDGTASGAHRCPPDCVLVASTEDTISVSQSARTISLVPISMAASMEQIKRAVATPFRPIGSLQGSDLADQKSVRIGSATLTLRE